MTRNTYRTTAARDLCRWIVQLRHLERRAIDLGMVATADCVRRELRDTQRQLHDLARRRDAIDGAVDGIMAEIGG